ncbi:hypothetical protein B0H13DRAFT_1878103 [Mycena leptocephala]|nr:hypothetical protein B0H13DRAFT_1878103 [Mycena leptocephala]
MSNLSTPTSSSLFTKRRRAYVACNNCRKRKAKCVAGSEVDYKPCTRWSPQPITPPSAGLSKYLGGSFNRARSDTVPPAGIAGVIRTGPDLPLPLRRRPFDVKPRMGSTYRTTALVLRISQAGFPPTEHPGGSAPQYYPGAAAPNSRHGSGSFYAQDYGQTYAPQVQGSWPRATLLCSICCWAEYVSFRNVPIFIPNARDSRESLENDRGTFSNKGSVFRIQFYTAQ